MKSLASVCLCIAGFLTFGAGAPVAVAAPQVLALIPTDQAIPLHCDGRTCSTRVSTFCLQRWRPSPEAGVRYVATGGEGLRLPLRIVFGPLEVFAAGCDLRLQNGLPIAGLVQRSARFGGAVAGFFHRLTEDRLHRTETMLGRAADGAGLAVLQDAVECYQKYALARDPKGRMLFEDAEEWIDMCEREWPFSYENICEILGLHPEYIRRGLSKWRQQRAPLKRTTARIVPLLERRGVIASQEQDEALLEAS